MTPQHTPRRADDKPPTLSALPTVGEVNSLGEAIARDGFAPHEHAVSQLAGLVRRVASDQVSVDVVIDRSAPSVVRDRAFGAVSAHWHEHRAALLEHRDRFDASFDALRSAWLSHDRLRHSEPSFDELWRSRSALDQTRLAAARDRRAAFGEQAPANSRS